MTKVNLPGWEYEGAFGRYEKFAPTPFDRNINIDDEDSDRSHWFVMPVGRNRDSQPISEVNFKAFLEELGGERETVEVHRFGHWACGWLEILIVDPSDDAAMRKAYDLARFLEDYPVLDDEALSEAENDSAQESWDNWARSEVERAVEGLIEDEFNELYDEDWPCDPSELANELIDKWTEEHGLPEYETHSDGAHFDTDDIAKEIFDASDLMEQGQ
jgi:hypothetical protein